MNSLPEPERLSVTNEATSLSLEERIEDFLDHFCAPLVGVLPYRERNSLRQEARFHLECLIAEYREQNLSPEAAIETAFREFGESWKSGEAVLREWRPRPLPQGARRLTHTAIAQALAWFGPPTVACLLLIERYALYPKQEGLLPYLLALALSSPLIAGILTGLTARLKAGQSIGWAMSFLALISLCAGGLLLPKAEGLIFGLFQLGYWLPMGWIAATSAVSSLWQHRRHRFLRPARR